MNSGFNSHATRGNSLEGARAAGYRFPFQFPCYAREFTSVKRAVSAVFDVSIPMLRAGIHINSIKAIVNGQVSIPMLRAGIHQYLCIVYNFHHWVSIPMLRAGIHKSGMTCSTGRMCFNSHATRGNSRLASAMPILSVFQRSIVRIGKIS